LTFADAIARVRYRVGDGHLASMARQQLGDRPGVAGRLEHDMVVRAERHGEGPQIRWARFDPTEPTQRALLVHGNLGEAPVDIERDRAHHSLLLVDDQ
jgi:hypothetical protein